MPCDGGDDDKIYGTGTALNPYWSSGGEGPMGFSLRVGRPRRATPIRAGCS